MKPIVFILAFLALHGYVQPFVFPSQVQNIMDKAVKNGMNEFALNLYKATLKEKSGNFVASPFGAYIALALATYGAEGTTRQELWNVMHLPNETKTTEQFIKTSLQNIMNTFKGATDLTVLNKNQVFINESLSASRQYREILRETFYTSFDTVNFPNTKQTAETINNWAKRVSRNRISEMVTSETLDPNTVLVLANALYFSGEWVQPFEEARPRDFYVSENVVKSVSMMIRYGNALHGNLPALKANFIQLPYKNGNGREEATYMYIIMPVQGKDFAYLEENISSLKLEDLQQGSVDDSIISLPKFKMDTTLQLADHILKMGAPTAFSGAANFSRISVNPEGLAISKIVQRTSLAVDEIKTVVISLTNIELVALAMPYIFKADRPFLMVIATKDVILFTGKVVDPTQ
ncbi:antichymotrypsin-2-like [Diachasmimorpha longicaudata]|uniref:antichymotrypsin-2-like n=1 Tax=Diachasmimorpha longicaudata TaxID=58733 RepID=UPI0030B88584